ncbi:MAG: protein-disulfide isomerase [Sphingomonas bacterium]|uniref:DsbA family protein n=1 Tax=Sphingomonas bacterium TaxID=1895847 RepID=UPI00261F66D8|nr:thioredoxin domain-containing protein [Sphingomonas bacterium]MDB5696603.1 protein-disulfide isomerase [Sphingomonas bacterium]
MKFLVPLALSLSLAACGGTTGSTGDNTAAAAPVAGTAAPAGQDWTQTVARTAEGFVMGNPNAPIKLVEYGSRLCPTCKAFADAGYKPLTENYVKAGKVSFEFREFLVHGPADMPPALLGTCVGTEPFFPLMEQMFANQPQFTDKFAAAQQALQTAPPAQRFRAMADAMGLVDFVKQRGVPEAKAQACLTDAAEIDRLTKITQDKGPGGDGTVAGTPTFLLNGKVAEGAISWAQVEEALKKAGA